MERHGQSESREHVKAHPFMTSEAILRSLIPQQLKPAVRSFYHLLFRVRLRLECWYEDRLDSRNDFGPIPPALLRFRVSESVSAREFLRIGERCADLVEQHIKGMEADLSTAQRVLDFGCGCGRTIKWLIQEYPHINFYGADVDREAIDWCQAFLNRASFVVNQPDPPLEYPDHYFDVIYCFSVFTHLNEHMQDRWLKELKRILRPGGVLLLSVYGQAAAKLLDRESLEIMSSVGFLHRKSRKLKGIVPDWYHTTWHSREYILNRLLRHFQTAKYEPVLDSVQDVVVAKA